MKYPSEILKFNKFVKVNCNKFTKGKELIKMTNYHWEYCGKNIMLEANTLNLLVNLLIEKSMIKNPEWNTDKLGSLLINNGFVESQPKYYEKGNVRIKHSYQSIRIMNKISGKHINLDYNQGRLLLNILEIS